MNKANAGKIAGVLFWHAVDIVFYGIALKFLAEWFLTPTFHTAHVGWGASFGLVIIVRLLVTRHEEAERAITFQNLIEEAIVPALLTEAGQLIHHFLP
jgi:heme/copper-type cytochrome/quinol oxidase subunit 3